MSFEASIDKKAIRIEEGTVNAPKLGREERLQNIREQVGRIRDSLGRPIDEGVKESVAIFNALGLRTTQSCEGHFDEDEGERTPCIEIGPREPDEEEWFENEEMRQQIERERLELHRNAINRLTEFYEGRKVPYDGMLGLSNIGYRYKVQSNGAESWEMLSEEQRQEKLGTYQRELRKFAAFLLEKFEAE